MEQLLASKSEANTIAQFLKECSFGEVELESDPEQELSASVSNRCPVVRDRELAPLNSTFAAPVAWPLLGRCLAVARQYGSYTTAAVPGVYLIMQVSIQGASLEELASRYGVGLPTAVCLSSIMMDIRGQLEAELSRMVGRGDCRVMPHVLHLDASSPAACRIFAW